MQAEPETGTARAQLRFDALPELSPWSFALGSAVLLLSIEIFMFSTLLGEGADAGAEIERRVRMVFCLQISTLLGTVAYFSGFFRTLREELLEVCASDPRVTSLPSFSVRAIAGAALTGILVHLVLSELIDGFFSSLGTGELGASDVWRFALGLLYYSLAAPTVYAGLVVSDRLRQLGSDVEVRLRDTTPLHVFAAVGLRTSFVAILIIALESTTATGWAEFEASALATQLGLLAVSSLTGGALLVLPMLGVRQSIRTRKADALKRIELSLEEAAPASIIEPTTSTEHVAALLTLRRHVIDTPDWPIDPAGVRKFGLFLLLPLGSWVGGALVERIVDAALE